MRVYCYQCPECQERSLAATNEPRICGPCWLKRERTVYLRRDYRAESVNVGNVKP